MPERGTAGIGRRIGGQCLVLLAVALAGALLSATLARYAPGFGLDERQLDARLSAESQASARAEAEAGAGVVEFYRSYLAGLGRGDLGVSRSLRQPVAELLAERGPVTLRAAGLGLLGAWLAGLAAALAATSLPGAALALSELAGDLAAGLLLAVPPAVLAVLFFAWQGPVALAIALALFPKIYRYSKNVLSAVRNRPHVLLAHAKGLAPVRIWARHIVPQAGPELAALAGVSVSVAMGAAVPLEVVCDLPGAGKLVWQAALARDLPLLVNLTLAGTLLALSANMLATLVAEAAGGRQA